MESNIGIVIQARTGSQRLTDKILKPIGEERSLLDFILKRFEKYNYSIPIIVATTKNPNDERIVNIVNKYNTIQCFRGNEENVLDRFIGCANKFQIDKIIRVCADNPFIDLKSIDKIIKEISIRSSDYIAFYLNNMPSIRTHFGFWAEGITLVALKKISLMTKEKIYIEHVTNYIYDYEHHFKIKKIELPKLFYENQNMRFTLDTKQDFENINNLLKQIETNKINAEYIINITKQYGSILEMMKIEIENNQK